MKFCDNCGAALEPGIKFCNQCGARVEPANPAAAMPGTPQGPNVSAPQGPNIGAPAGKWNEPPAPPPPGGRPKGSVQQTMALYDQDYDSPPQAGQQAFTPPQPPQPPQQAFTPKPQQQVYTPKPQAVYPPQQGGGAHYPPPQYPSPGVYPAASGAQTDDSLIFTIGMLLVMSIPVLGLIPAIICIQKQDTGYRRTLAISMIIVNVIWTVIWIVTFFQFYNILSQVSDISITWFWQ